MMSAPTLVVLAAGLGSRYGGLKQLEPVGPTGEAIMDYSVYDAARAGFTRVVFVVRPDIRTLFLDFAIGRFGHALEIVTAVQRIEDVPDGAHVPPGRTKPWGTTQAVLAAAPAVHGPFAVVNADDFYGRRAFEALAHALATDDGADALVGYRLSDTMSEAGAVNRAVCDVGDDGWLRGLRETLDLAPAPDDPNVFVGRTPSGETCRVPGDALVSMNAWGFREDTFATLRASFVRFLASDPGLTAECYLPESMNEAIRRGTARVRVLDARSTWLGITYPGDRERVERALRALTDAGEYPASLWGTAPPA